MVIKCHTEPKARGDLNDDGNFMNGWDFGNVRNVRTDIKCYTFLKSQARADLNDDGNFWIGGNVRTDIKCHIFLEQQA